MNFRFKTQLSIAVVLLLLFFYFFSYLFLFVSNDHRRINPDQPVHIGETVFSGYVNVPDRVVSDNSNKNLLSLSGLLRKIQPAKMSRQDHSFIYQGLDDQGRIKIEYVQHWPHQDSRDDIRLPLTPSEKNPSAGTSAKEARLQILAVPNVRGSKEKYLLIKPLDDQGTAVTVREAQ